MLRSSAILYGDLCHVIWKLEEVCGVMRIAAYFIASGETPVGKGELSCFGKLGESFLPGFLNRFLLL